MMENVFHERVFDPAITTGDVAEMAEAAGDCFVTNRVEWVNSALSTDGSRMLCWFQSPDVESTRRAVRQSGSPLGSLWRGTVHDAPEAPAEPANVIVVRSWDEPVALDDIQAIEDAGIACLETHRVRFVRTYFAADRRRMICLYQAPDAESVRLAQRQAGMPLDRVWAFQLLQPESN